MVKRELVTHSDIIFCLFGLLWTSSGRVFFMIFTTELIDNLGIHIYMDSAVKSINPHPVTKEFSAYENDLPTQEAQIKQ